MGSAPLGESDPMRYVILFGVAAFLAVGCRTHSKRTVDQFEFVEIGMPMTVVSNRIGMPDLPYRGQIRWRYRLADGSEMAIVSDGGETFENWRVTWFGQWRGDKWLWAKPADALE